MSSPAGELMPCSDRPARWGPGHYRGYFRRHLVLTVQVKGLVAEGFSLEQIRGLMAGGSRHLKDALAVAEAVAEEDGLVTA